jgi:hypothetical protein
VAGGRIHSIEASANRHSFVVRSAYLSRRIVLKKNDDSGEPFRGISVDAAGKVVKWSAMSDSYIIEVRSEPAGIIVRDRGGFRFFAASEEFQRMEGQYFRSAREAEREALAQSKSRGGSDAS